MKKGKGPFPCLGTRKVVVQLSELEEGSAAGCTQRCSMPCFLTLAFLIISGNQSGPPAGLGTIEMLPVKTWTRLVPRSRRRMVVCPRVAAFKAAPRGCLLANTWLVSFPFSMRTKYFFPSDIGLPPNRPCAVEHIMFFPKKGDTAPHMSLSTPFRKAFFTRFPFSPSF